MNGVPELGVGIGWREEIKGFCDRARGVGFVEVIAESLDRAVPRELDLLRERGIVAIPHGITLSVGGAEPPDPRRINRLAKHATRLAAPFVSEHLCFVRSGGLDSGHLLPLARTRESLAIAVENVRRVQAGLPVPLALENIAGLFEWPGAEMDEATFLGEVLEQTGALLLLDVANLHANAVNLGWDAIAFLDRVPLERLAYVHVAGGQKRDGFYHDTHAHAVPYSVLDLVAEVSSRVPSPNVLLERDENFPSEAEMQGELDAIADAIERGGRANSRETTCSPVAEARGAL
jgi:uncharacterized protein (UPF0276 family)